jgi:mycothiol synthase
VNVRPAEEEDFGRMLALLAEDEEHMFGRPSRLDMNDLRTWLGGVELSTNTWLFEEGADLAALGWTDGEPDLGFAIGVVAVPYKGRGLGDELVARAERRAREDGASRLHQITFAPDGAAARLMERHGYRDVRRFYELAIELDDEPAVPGGVPIEVLDPADGRAFYEALDEAFQDHWEHHARPFDEWWERHTGGQNYDPSLWFVVRDGDEIAAAARNEAGRNGGGYVGHLGVRRPWRGRGYARTLLLHTFAEFHRRGIRRVTLGVDAENPTGATKLYESVGMTPEQEHVVFEKALT